MDVPYLIHSQISENKAMVNVFFNLEKLVFQTFVFT